MRNLTLVMLFSIAINLLPSCNIFTPPDKKEKGKTKEQAVTTQSQSKNTDGVQTDENGLYSTQVVFIGDRSLSFINKYELPSANLFKPLCDKANTYSDAVFDFRYGLIFDNSDILFEQYHFQPQELLTSTEKKEKKNVWVESSKSKENKSKYSPPPNTDWNEFEQAIQRRLAKSPSRKSDIAFAIDRSIVSFREHPNGKKILILATDFDDSYSTIPTIDDNDIQIYVVGLVNPKVPVATILHHPVKQFESLNAALRDIIYNL